MAAPDRVITTFGPRQAGLYAICCLAAACAALVFLVEWLDGAIGYSRAAGLILLVPCLAIFSFGAVLCAIQVFRPGRILLSPAGLRLVGLWALPLIGWSEVDAFGIIRRQGVTRHVCFKLTEAAVARIGRPWWRVIAPEGFDGVLYTGPQEVSELIRDELEVWRARHLPATARPPS